MKNPEWRERARARLNGTTVLPGSCDKTRGAETLSAAAGAQLAQLLKSCSVQRALRARAREATIPAATRLQKSSNYYTRKTKDEDSQTFPDFQDSLDFPDSNFQIFSNFPDYVFLCISLFLCIFLTISA